MASRRLGVGVAVLNGQLYAVGGSDGQQPLASVEHYDPRVGTWHRMSCMGTRRKHLGVAVYNGLIYAVGGRDEVTELSSAECFDPRTRTWSPVVAMTSRRSGVNFSNILSLLSLRIAYFWFLLPFSGFWFHQNLINWLTDTTEGG